MVESPKAAANLYDLEGFYVFLVECQGISHYEMVPSDQTFNLGRYWHQLDGLKKKQSLRGGRLWSTGEGFYSIKTTPGHSDSDSLKILETWVVLKQPAYSPFVPSNDYYHQKIISKTGCEDLLPYFFPECTMVFELLNKITLKMPTNHRKSGCIYHLNV